MVIFGGGMESMEGGLYGCGDVLFVRYGFSLRGY